MSMKKYVLRKVVTDFVIINIMINGVFYFLNFRTFSGQLRFNDLVTDLFVGLLLLGGACSFIGFVNMRKELAKGRIDVAAFQTSQLYHKLPKAIGLRVLFLILMTAIITAAGFILLPKLLGVDKINHLIGFGFKTLTAGMMAAIIGYIVVDLSISDYQQSHLAIEKTTIV